MDVYQKIRDGEYENRREYPSRPVEPKMPAAIHLMTVAQFTAYKEQVAAHERAKERYKEQKRFYNLGEGEAIERFWADVAENEGIDPKDPFFLAMRSAAWERGHGNGYNEVLNAFDDLLPLWVLYRDKRPA